MSMMLCPKCGKPVSDDTTFCLNCGALVSEQQNQPAAVQAPASQPQNTYVQQPVQAAPAPQPQNTYVQPPVQNYPAVQPQNTYATQPAVQNTYNNQPAAYNQASTTDLSNVNITAKAPRKGGSLALLIFGIVWTVITAILFIWLLTNEVFGIPFGLLIGIGCIITSRPDEITITNSGVFIHKFKRTLTWNMVNNIQCLGNCITIFGGGKTYKLKNLPNSAQLADTMNQLLQQSRR